MTELMAAVDGGGPPCSRSRIICEWHQPMPQQPPCVSSTCWRRKQAQQHFFWKQRIGTSHTRCPGCHQAHRNESWLGARSGNGRILNHVQSPCTGLTVVQFGRRAQDDRAGSERVRYASVNSCRPACPVYPVISTHLVWLDPHLPWQSCCASVQVEQLAH
jgi:hypothetical protein